ncbi:uncharacterized protein CLAFUR5_13829 [Fulvia fulva]|uniref:Uncharacterized protein n=1 Tax=Passalora fulva TaxID=5499 RepID=A0A9Q8PL89_PASFU|nr:uncharacterized protein CLAFUR5_13829 [Fulvia fulva]UJO24500.1 hypothetical protein CLAFUR5_13829 [Fulvia fulva]WPV37030.1 hypothetical protein CLAFUW7_13999 [Fulvia fulva]
MVQIKSPDFNSATDGPKHYWKIDNHRHSIANLRGRKHIDQNMANIGISKFVSDKMTTELIASKVFSHATTAVSSTIRSVPYQNCAASASLADLTRQVKRASTTSLTRSNKQTTSPRSTPS